MAINWNAPFAYLAGALEALNAGFAPSFAADGVARKSTVISSSSSIASSSSQVASSSSVAPASSSSEQKSSSSQWNPWVSSSSAITAIHETLPASMQNKAAPRIRQNCHQLYVEKNGKRFDLLGNSVR